MTPTDEIASAITSNPGSTDRELARVLKTTPRRVAAARQSLGIPPHKPAKTLDANVWLRVPKSTRTAVEGLASTEGVTMSAWCAAAIVERMERVRDRMDRLHLPPAFKVGDRVRWVGTAEAWNPDWGQPGDVGTVTDAYADVTHVTWDRSLNDNWLINLANLAPESDYIGSP